MRLGTSLAKVRCQDGQFTIPKADNGVRSVYPLGAIASIFLQQLRRTHPERLRQFLDDHACRIASPTLNVADIGTMDTGLVSECFLAPSLFLAEAAKVVTKATSDIHKST